MLNVQKHEQQNRTEKERKTTMFETMIYILGAYTFVKILFDIIDWIEKGGRK